jgi:hypothetical protein
MGDRKKKVTKTNKKIHTTRSANRTNVRRNLRSIFFSKMNTLPMEPFVTLIALDHKSEKARKLTKKEGNAKQNIKEGEGVKGKDEGNGKKQTIRRDREKGKGIIKSKKASVNISKFQRKVKRKGGTKNKRQKDKRSNWK